MVDPELEQMILVMRERMQAEIDSNSRKGNWREFTNVGDILLEIQYHHAKLLMAMRELQKCPTADVEANQRAVMEYIADCANIYMFLANALHVLPNEIH